MHYPRQLILSILGVSDWSTQKEHEFAYAGAAYNSLVARGRLAITLEN
jgi:hypothetical protein